MQVGALPLSSSPSRKGWSLRSRLTAAGSASMSTRHPAGDAYDFVALARRGASTLAPAPSP
eukprot:9608757-Alexandrium_andersonii.AAC.1